MRKFVLNKHRSPISRYSQFALTQHAHYQNWLYCSNPVHDSMLMSWNI